MSTPDLPRFGDTWAVLHPQEAADDLAKQKADIEKVKREIENKGISTFSIRETRVQQMNDSVL
jgi:hypothetical protein